MVQKLLSTIPPTSWDVVLLWLSTASTNKDISLALLQG